MFVVRLPFVALGLGLGLAACADSGNVPNPGDLAIRAHDASSTGDGATATGDAAMSMMPGDGPMSIADGGARWDLTGGACQPDPGGDQQACSNGCPSGTVGVSDGTSCTCWYACDPKGPSECLCGRSCRALYTQDADGGVVATGTGACMPGNGPGERCGFDSTGKPNYNWGRCLDSLLCVSEDSMGVDSYCMYTCTSQSDCPRGTTCLGLTGGTNLMACVIEMGSGGVATGMPCTYSTVCALGDACDGTDCRATCNGPKDTSCSGGTACKPLVDPNNQKISAYTCQ